MWLQVEFNLIKKRMHLIFRTQDEGDSISRGAFECSSFQNFPRFLTLRPVNKTVLSEHFRCLAILTLISRHGGCLVGN